MLEIIRGVTSNKAKELQLIKMLESMNVKGNLFLGYPLLEDDVKVDASLIVKDKGIILFSFSNEKDLDLLEEELNIIYLNVESKLRREKTLNESRDFKVKIEVFNFNEDEISEYSFTSREELEILYNKVEWREGDKYFSYLLSAVQSLADLKKKTKSKLKKEGSKGRKYQKLQEEIAVLDKTQAQAVLETTDKPQRIRGLAGSGKTIVLAMKAAYLHSLYPTWDIVVTYSTRTLHNQFIDLIDRFTIKYTGEKADFTKVKVMNTWGSPSSPGIYYEVCEKHGAQYLNFTDAKNIYGRERAATGIYEKLVTEVKKFKKMYDVILIDEAQDLPQDFFKVCYSVLGEKKRIVWAYDELQSLNNLKMSSPEELFGYNLNGEPYVQLRNDLEKAKEDIILETCYRNSKPVLTTAHALGFGIYRKNLLGQSQLVQMFSDTKLWRDIGYEVKEGNLLEGEKVKLERTNKSSPLYLVEELDDNDLIIFKKFNTLEEESEWLAREILSNLKVDELEYRDILIIHPNVQEAAKKVGYLRNLLEKMGINTILAGSVGSRETFFEENSITISHIYRAKGNEAPMVYLMDADFCYTGSDLITKRNILFTAITRSKGWVRVLGVGENMEKLISEYEKVKENGYSLDFIYPTREEQEKLNTIHRDRTKDEEENLKKGLFNIESVIELLKQENRDEDDETSAKLEMLRQVLNGEKK
ncbi:ATP-binding domain-containing protein [Cetobacterium somerae]|uniref:DEAD/DEAH box helicase n=1 Tax=Cetobacterium somerae TaxID=188913 RepID=UPI002E7BC3B3|nr:ATP-binding domain-containing protein [Cetobacterium somerae]WVJ02149.1 ATP-binding domain-containing protein [Cetobacterium somerae]